MLEAIGNYQSAVNFQSTPLCGGLNGVVCGGGAV